MPGMDITRINDETTEHIQAAAQALLAGRATLASAELRAIDAAALRAQWDAAFARRRALGLKTNRAAEKRRWTTHDESRPIYERDRYTCRYCGKRTIHVRVLEVLSFAFPVELPYGGRSWPMAHTHMIYWTHTTSLEHLVPHARGGDFDAAENLGVACWQCNHVKGDALIEEMGFRSRVAETQWDGLTGLVPELARVADYHGEKAAEWRRYGSKPRKAVAAKAVPALVAASRPAPAPQPVVAPQQPASGRSVARFLNDETGYQQWLDANPAGYVLAPGSKIRGESGPALHHASCTHINYPDPRWRYTRKVKICSTDRSLLTSIAGSEYGRPPLMCSSCF